ncbi:hypothetical protein R3P38DRAFT_3576064 [Favolaschia claudopus]|uniref:Uncharacterized protein n=1 Tax=Favolaschia claudopus TaxID=2862362 RepID=A0AAW0ALU1_9AGAR
MSTSLMDSLFGSDSSRAPSPSNDEISFDIPMSPIPPSTSAVICGTRPPLYSPLTAIDIPWTTHNVLEVVLSIPDDIRVRTDLALLLRGPGFEGCFPSATYCWRERSNGKFVMKTHYRQMAHRFLTTIAGLITSAANNQSVSWKGFLPEYSTTTIPALVLHQWGIDFPSAVLCLWAGWAIADSFTASFGKIMICGIRDGVDSISNPGAGLQMCPHEWYSTVGGGSTANPFFERWLDQYLHDPAYVRRADIAAGRLFTHQGVSHFFVVDAGAHFFLHPHIRPGVNNHNVVERELCDVMEFGERIAMAGF